jgi:glycosyltransferase involved in cell wall biosynthesis
MRPLRVALVHRDSDRCTDKRMVGIWSYDVPEFSTAHFAVKRGFVLDRADFAGDFDLIFYEDGKLHGRFVGPTAIPVVYYVVDSTLSGEHYEKRREQAAQADLVVVDHDELGRFRWPGGPPVRRLSHCVNDRLFRDYGEERTVDVSFHCRTKGSTERAKLAEWLAVLCGRSGYRYRTGTLYDEDYPRGFNRSRLTVNLTRTPGNRPHRIFDAMACRTCVVTNRLRDVSDEVRRAGMDYVEYADRDGLAAAIAELLHNDAWRDVAERGYQLVQEHHTWAVRARELRRLLQAELGL